MLILTRKTHEKVVLQWAGKTVVITVTEIRRDKGIVKLAFDAPREVRIDREEIAEAKAMSPGEMIEETRLRT
jgi:carbon storage regulator CsrA